MHYSTIAIVLAAIPATLALPHDHGHHGSHHDSLSAAASATATAPYDSNNGTLSAAGTDTGTAANVHYSTVRRQSTLYQTVSSSSSQASGGAIEEAGASNADSCGSATTVTLSPSATVTVTVNGNGGPAQSGVESSAPVVASSIAPVSSAVADLMTSAPVVASVTPQSTSQIPEARAPSEVANSASVTSSVAPVQTYATSAVSSVAPVESSSAAPDNPQASTPASSAAVAASGVASADYCQDTPDPYALKTGESLVWTGANYTGGVKGKKRGIVFVAAIDEQKALVDYANANPNIHWLGNYYSAPPLEYEEMKFEFVPQMYGKQSIGQEWDTNAARAVKAGVKNFLSFGEAGTPNPKNQENPQQAAQTFIDQMQPYVKDGVTIGAPGSLGGPQDLKWEQDFLCQCQKLGCNIGFQTGHWFDAAAPLEQQVARAKGTIESYIAIAKGKPVWFENIWAKGSAAEQKAFMDVLVPWLEDNPAIERYGWVPMDDRPADGDPFTSGGSPTDLATHFASNIGL